ncbi:MAG: phosphoribosylformylglycinamidine cyclo-ligase [Bacteroidetes bacterium]|nr:phosphoribosylformylglycinamidine cyclo-ligase [Bacteroidota bacterium]
MQNTEQSEKYAARGVSAGKEDVHAAIVNTDKGLFPKAFCKIFPDFLANDPSMCTIMHADGAGTKSSLAYAYYKLTNDISVWKGIAQDALVMNTDDLMCAGAIDDILYSSTIGRNKHLVGGEIIKSIIEGTEQLINELGKFGIKIYTTGGETADVGDLVRTIIVDTTVACRLQRNRVIDNAKISPGDVIVAFASYGEATYESGYNGGMGSNGLTSARHDVFDKSIAEHFPETYDSALPEHLVYCGRYKLTDEIRVDKNNPTVYIVNRGNQLLYQSKEKVGDDYYTTTMGKLVLSPTRTYLPLVKDIFLSHHADIHGMIHCSGGGQTKVLHFIDQLEVVKNNLLPVPPLFDIIQHSSGSELSEMFKVFNMGHRLEIYTHKQAAESMIEIARRYNIPAQIIGYCKPAAGKQVSIHYQDHVFNYTS